MLELLALTRLPFITLIRMLLINSWCQESMNESEKIGHDSECLSVNTLVSDLLPPHPTQQTHTQSSLIHYCVQRPQRQIVAYGNVMKQC